MKRGVKKDTKKLAYLLVCHPLMKKHDKKVNNNQPTNKYADKHEHSLIPQDKFQPMLPASSKPAAKMT